MSASTKTNINKKRMLEALTKTLGVVTQACEEADVSRTQFYKWVNEDDEFKKEVESVSDIAIDFTESKLFKQIDEENITAIIFYLKTKAKHRGYIERQENINYNEPNLPEWMKEDE